MGFEHGRGLGKNLQGRAMPIQVQKRQGKGAVGRYGNEDPNIRPVTSQGNCVNFKQLYIKLDFI